MSTKLNIHLNFLTF